MFGPKIQLTLVLLFTSLPSTLKSQISLLNQFSFLGCDSDLSGCYTLDQTLVLTLLTVIVISLPIGDVFWDTLNKSLIAASNNS